LNKTIVIKRINKVTSCPLILSPRTIIEKRKSKINKRVIIIMEEEQTKSEWLKTYTLITPVLQTLAT